MTRYDFNMDIITMKLLEKKYNLPTDIVKYEIFPFVQFEKLTNQNIRMAVNLYMSNITECERKFGPIENWNVSSVTDMSCMFYNARKFNADISKWNVQNCTDMSFMFCDAKNFNADISNWTVQNCKNMSFMFSGAINFNADISKWNVSPTAVTFDMLDFVTCRDFEEYFEQFTLKNLINSLLIYLNFSTDTVDLF